MITNPRFQTNEAPGVNEMAARRAPIWWMKVTAVSPGENTSLLTCVLSDATGTVVGTKSYTVELTASHVVGDFILVHAPGGGTKQTYNGQPVALREIGGGGISLVPITLVGTMAADGVTALGGGKYAGHLNGPAADGWGSLSGDLAYSDFITVPPEVQVVYFSNPAEVGLSTHYLVTTSGALPLVFWCYPTGPGPDGTPTYCAVYAEQPGACT